MYVRGKYRDVILPMFVLRRLDTLLGAKQDAVLEEMRFQKKNWHSPNWMTFPQKKLPAMFFITPRNGH